MGISPTYKTSIPTTPTWKLSLVPDSGTYDVSGLSTSNFSLLIHNLETGVETTGAGTWSGITAAVTSTTAGITTIVSHAFVQYQVASSEVNIGRYRLWVLITTNAGVQPFKIDEDWEVKAL